MTGADGRIYALGGDAGNGFRPATRTVQIYDPSSGTWSLGTSMLTPRAGFAATVGADGRFYVMGGYDARGQGLHSLQAYDPGTDSWSALAKMPAARSALAAATGGDGKIYALGGYGSGVTATVQAYDPATNTWTVTTPMPTARAALAAVTGPDGRVYALGGTDGSSMPTGAAEAYQP